MGRFNFSSNAFSRTNAAFIDCHSEVKGDAIVGLDSGWFFITTTFTSGEAIARAAMAARIAKKRPWVMLFIICCWGDRTAGTADVPLSGRS
eukprot:4348486-Ditylum_brightwellii.AAC.1